MVGYRPTKKFKQQDKKFIDFYCISMSGYLSIVIIAVCFLLSERCWGLSSQEKAAHQEPFIN
jgi:hypothetical protein